MIREEKWHIEQKEKQRANINEAKKTRDKRGNEFMLEKAKKKKRKG